MPPNVHLLPRLAAVSNETIQELEFLLREARAGNISGFAYLALHDGPKFSENIVGRCQAIPVLTLGMLRLLQKHVEELI